MNPAEIANVARVRIPVNICRCCLVEDSYRDISYKYYYSGGKEIYEEMLYETFNIQISEHDGCTRLICDRCVTRLRDAYEFKQMVQQNENSFGGYLESWNQNAVKIELLNDDLNNPTADLKVDDKQEPANSTDNDGLSNIKSTPNGDDNISGDVRVKLKRSYTEPLDTLEKKSKRVFEEDTMKLDIEPVTIKSELIVPIENELSTEDYNDVFSDQQPNLEIKVEIEHPDNDIPIEHFADGQHCDDDFIMAESGNSMEYQNERLVVVDVHHRHWSQSDTFDRNTNTKRPKTVAERVRECRARKSNKSQSACDASSIIYHQNDKIFIAADKIIENVRKFTKRRPKTVTERVRECRARKRLKKQLESGASLTIAKRPKTAAERTREWRARKKIKDQSGSDASLTIDH